MMDTKDVKALFELAGAEPYAYSGRGMYGKCCLALNVDSIGDLAEVVALAATYCDGAEDFADSMRGASSDSMGRGMVVYWPALQMGGAK